MSNRVLLEPPPQSTSRPIEVNYFHIGIGVFLIILALLGYNSKFVTIINIILLTIGAIVLVWHLTKLIKTGDLLYLFHIFIGLILIGTGIAGLYEYDDYISPYVPKYVKGLYGATGLIGLSAIGVHSYIIYKKLN